MSPLELPRSVPVPVPSPRCPPYLPGPGSPRARPGRAARAAGGPWSVLEWGGSGAAAGFMCPRVGGDGRGDVFTPRSHPQQPGVPGRGDFMARVGDFMARVGDFMPSRGCATRSWVTRLHGVPLGAGPWACPPTPGDRDTPAWVMGWGHPRHSFPRCPCSGQTPVRGTWLDLGSSEGCRERCPWPPALTHSSGAQPGLCSPCPARGDRGDAVVTRWPSVQCPWSGGPKGTGRWEGRRFCLPQMMLPG